MIKHSGIVRRMDDLGRIVIPKEMRSLMGIKEGDAYEISCTDNGFILEKYNAEEEIKEIKEEVKAEKILVKIKQDCERRYSYIKLSKEALDFLDWLNDEGLLDGEVVYDVVDEVEVIEF